VTRRPILSLGARGQRVSVTVRLARGVKRYVVSWREQGQRATEWFPHNAPGRVEALAFAHGVYDALRAPATPAPERVTVEELGRRFFAGQGHLRPRSRTLYTNHWTLWQTVVGPHVVAEDLTPETCVKVREVLEKRSPPLGVNTLTKFFQTVRTIYRWGLTYGVIQSNRVGLYVFKVAKERRPAPPAEYSQSEFEKLLAVVPFDAPGTWRPHVALALCALQGIRQNQALHLDWSDVDLAGRRLRWRPEWDKKGEDRTQPMREPVHAMLTALWEARGQPTAGWVLPGANPRDPGAPYTIQALWWAIRKAETRADVTRQRGRAGHGFRRLLAGNVAEESGDAKLAMDAIGDRDMRMLSRYVQVRDERLRKVFAALDNPERANEMQTAGTSPERAERKSR
jgi:integrase